MNGIRIAKTDKDVSTLDVNDLSMTSEYNSSKIFDDGIWTQVVAPSTLYTGVVIKEHNLGYIPLFRAYIEPDVGSNIFYQLPSMVGVGTVTGIVYADTTKLYVDLDAGSSTTPGTLKGYYFIFKV